jgi:CRISPR-associated protein Cas1
VLDFMEPQRPLVDRKVLAFVQEHTFHPADFTIRSDGVCRINPEMARRLVKQLHPTRRSELAHVFETSVLK